MITNAYGPKVLKTKIVHGKNSHYKGAAGIKHWLIGGDFNIILTLEEKTGGTKRLDQDSGKL
jgi:hypothetical protein